MKFKSLGIGLVFLCSVSAWAVGELPSHLAQNATTLRPGQIAFEPHPGANPLKDESFLEKNSLSVGVSSRVQVGTVLRPWLVNNERNRTMNVTAKIAVYQDENFKTALGFALAKFDAKATTSDSQFEVSGELAQPSINLNYQFHEDWDVTYNVSSAFVAVYGRYELPKLNKSGEIPRKFIRGHLDQLIDLRFAQTGSSYWIFGLSRNYENVADISEGLVPTHGAGISFGWLMPRNVVSMASLGLHFTDRQNVKTVFGLAF